jgi:hypothetical protein
MQPHLFIHRLDLRKLEGVICGQNAPRPFTTVFDIAPPTKIFCARRVLAQVPRDSAEVYKQSHRFAIGGGLFYQSGMEIIKAVGCMFAGGSASIATELTLE